MATLIFISISLQVKIVEIPVLQHQEVAMENKKEAREEQKVKPHQTPTTESLWKV